MVEINDHRTTVKAAPGDRAEVMAGAQAGTITAEQFMEAMAKLSPDIPAKLSAFIDRLGQLGVYPEFKRSLNLKWNPPEGKPINVSYIMRHGHVATDASNWFAPHQLSHAYNDDLAKRIGGTVDKKTEKCYVKLDGKAPHIGYMLEKADNWYFAIERFIASLLHHMDDVGGK